MKNLFALVSVSVLLLQVSSIGAISAQMPPEKQQLSQVSDKLADTYNRNGTAKYRAKDFQGAIANYNIAIRIDPQFAAAYSNRGAVKLQIGDKDGAVVDWTKASELYRQQGNISRSERLLARINKLSTVIPEEEPIQKDWRYTSQLTDIKPTDRYYQAVQSLVERYGVMYAYNDGKFHPERRVTRRQLVVFLNSSLDRLYEIKNANSRVRSNRSCSDKPLTSNPALCSKYSLYKNNVNLVKQIKDIRVTDDYFVDIRSLVEDYGIKIIDADNNFRFSKPVTKKELYDVMNGVFNYRPAGSPVVSKETLNRGEFVIILNDVLDRAVERISLMQQ